MGYGDAPLQLYLSGVKIPSPHFSPRLHFDAIWTLCLLLNSVIVPYCFKPKLMIERNILFA